VVRTRNSGWDNDHVGASEGLLHAIVCREVTLDLLPQSQCLLFTLQPRKVAYGNGGDVGEIGGDTWGVDNIVESELVDKRASLHEEGERLANATGSTCDDCEA